MIPPVKNIRSLFHDVDELWSPRVVGQVNNQYVKIAKVQGELAWHKHDDEDEMFLVVKGALCIEYQDGKAELSEGDFHIVPRGVLHNPIAREECWLVLIEPVATKHTGDTVTEKTKPIEAQVADGDL